MDDTSGRVETDVSRRPDNRGDDATGRSTERTRGYAESANNDVDQRTREIRNEIEETRGEMSETIDAIQEKLKPQNIVADATDRVKTAATERVREMADTASQTAQQAIDYTRDRASTMAGSARENPIPLALIGIGAAWLLTKRSRRTPDTGRGRYQRDFGDYGQAWTSDESPYEDENNRGVMARIRENPLPAALAGVGLTWLAFSRGDRPSNRWRETSTDVASRTREYASETTDSIRRMARKRQSQVERMVQENPLLVGAGALMLGAAFGLAVPETETENEWMGETRDNVVERAREAARDAATQVQDAASSVADAAKKLTGKPQP